MLPINPPTKAQQLKQYVIALALDLLTDQEQEIESGIEEGLYDREENKETLQRIEEQRKQIKEYENYQPAVFVFVEGGLIQGASGTENISFNLFDKDNYNAGDDQQGFIDNFGTPEEWEKMIEDKTAQNEIGGIF